MKYKELLEKEEYTLEKSNTFNKSSRLESDFYNEEDNVKNTCSQVKRIKLPDNEEDWHFIKDKKVVFVLKGIKFSKKEKEYLRTVEGVKFLMHGFNSGWDNYLDFKRELKK